MDNGAASARHMFGTYEILETVGQGGMGVVYRAYDTTLKRVVALKILRDDLREQPHLVARFKREAEAFACLNHPNIVHIFSVGRVGRIPYLAMECIDGTPLSRLLKAERRLPWERALEIALEIAQALKCAHRAQIIHRDIKPGNIIIGQDAHAYVTDFGIAKVLNAETQLTVDGARLGTPQYMSPERCQNKETTASSDIYSLGILLYQMIAGRLPFQNDTPVELIQQIMVETPPRLSTIFPGIPDNVDRLVAYMIEKDPAARPASADFLCEILERVRAGKPIVEHDGEATANLRDYRETQTPTPLPARKASLTRAMRWQAAAKERMHRVPLGSRAFWLTALAIAAIAVATASYAFAAARLDTRDALPRLSRDVSSWHASGPVATFVDEGPAIVTAEIHLDNFQITDAVWIETSIVALRLAGASGTPCAGYDTIVRVDTESREAELVVPPFAGASVSFAGGGAGRFYSWIPSQPNALFSWNAQDYAPTKTAMHVPPDIEIESVSSVNAATPFSGGVIAALQFGASTSVIAEVGNTYSALPTVTVDGVVSAIHTSPAGDAISMVITRPDGTRELSILSRGAFSPQTIATGRLLPDTGTFSPDGTALLVSRQDGGRRVNIVPLSGAPAIDLGDGGEAGWTAAGDVVCTAMDNQGRTQLFLAGANVSGTRRQLTFLSTGVGEMCTLSHDGKHAASSTMKDHRPVLVLLDTQDI